MTPGFRNERRPGRSGQQAALRRPASFPLGIILDEQRRGITAEPTAIASALGLDFGQVIFHDAVATGENGAIRADLVKARPDGRGVRVAHEHDVAAGAFGRSRVPLQALADDLDGNEPGDGRLNRPDEQNRNQRKGNGDAQPEPDGLSATGPRRSRPASSRHPGNHGGGREVAAFYQRGRAPETRVRAREARRACRSALQRAPCDPQAWRTCGTGLRVAKVGPLDVGS